jgi:hypothetical protein
LKHGVSTDVRKHQVENDEIGKTAIDSSERIEAVCRFLYFEAFERERDSVHTSELRIILDD